MRRTVGLCQPPEVETALHKAARRLYGEQQQESEQQRAQTATSKPPATFRMCSNRVRAPRASTMAVTGNISRYDAPAAPAPPAAVSPSMHTVCLHLHLHRLSGSSSVQVEESAGAFQAVLRPAEADVMDYWSSQGFNPGYDKAGRITAIPTTLQLKRRAQTAAKLPSLPAMQSEQRTQEAIVAKYWADRSGKP